MMSFPREYSAVIVPHIFSVSTFAIERPKPADPLADSTVKKRSKRRFALTWSRLDALFANDIVPLSVSVIDNILPHYSVCFQKCVAAPTCQAFVPPFCSVYGYPVLSLLRTECCKIRLYSVQVCHLYLPDTMINYLLFPL